MTTYVQARDALVAHINTGLTANYPNLPVFYENTKQVDLNTVGVAFLKVAINFQDTMQLTINDTPEDERSGEVNFSLFYKDGQGTRAGLAIFDYLEGLMRYRTLSGVKTTAPTPGRKGDRGGWISSDLNTPFTFTTLA